MEGDWIEYYCRDKQFMKVIDIAQRSGVDAKWKYYCGLGLVLKGKTQEGINILEPLLLHSDFGLAAALLSLAAHMLCETVDEEAMAQLEWKVEQTSNTEECGLQFAITALMHAGHYDKARSYLDRLLHLNSTSVSGLVLSGWLELSVGNQKAAVRLFKTALTHDKGNLDAILGEVKTLDKAEAMLRLNQLIVRYPKSTPPLIEKMRIQLAIKDWPQAVDTATRVLSLEPDNVIALELRALYHIVREGNYEEGALALRRYRGEVEVQQGDLVGTARLFSRVSGRHSALLEETTRLAERATQVNHHNAQALLELAAQHCLAGRLPEASSLYRLIIRLDSTSTEALMGLTAVQLAQSGPSDQVLQQVEFLTEVMGSQCTPDLLLLRAQCERDWTLLDQATSILYSTASAFQFGSQFLSHLNPDLLLVIANLYPDSAEGLAKRISILCQVVDACPGLVSAVLALAKAYAVCGNYSAATDTIQIMLTQIDATNTDAHLIMAQIHLSQNKFEEANASLELALSYNLQVRELPLYHVLLGAIQRHHGDEEACSQSMHIALSLNSGERRKLSVSELGFLYLELVASLTAIGNMEEASRILSEASEAMLGTEQEDRLLVVRGDLAALKGDYSTALKLLGDVQSDQLYYLQACKKMAEIHLHKLRDEQAFAECYKQLVAKTPSTENLLLLGDSYLTIQEPERAVETYEKAVRSSTTGAKLSIKLGQVLVRIHQYGRAIKCFRDAGSEGSLELAQLLLRLGQLATAEDTLADLPISQKALLLAKIREKSGDIPGAMNVIKEAREHIAASDIILNVKMCSQLAEYASVLRDHNTAISYYKRALQYKLGDTHIEIALAKLYMQVNDWSSCQSVCSTLLTRDPDNEPALLMLGDLAYRRVDFNDASAHFSALLTRHPDYWVALARLIEVKRRTAQLNDAKPFLQAATNIAAGEAGLSYCTGLYDWYNGNINSALHHFNCARGDIEWGQQALHNIVELCLAGDSGIATATRLLSQMKPHSQDEEINVRLLHNLILFSSKDKQDVELAIADLTLLASQETLRVGATLGLATGYVLQKQVARARNALKRVAKATWLVEEAEYLERCWLLLADLHVQASKHDPAVEVLRRVLTHNQSCYRAHELLGLIAEKEQKYLEAGIQYQQAWKLSRENDPALGFKLAFNLVKAKRYADAISTCHVVLKLNPEYPRIRKEILDKAISHMRT